ncbi:MAG: DUF1329 domain-containing protein [Candidatus Binataceae bacterium]|nr:DUF1329 domain-containing protein [Candidatus Binataceae bacterium]
MTGNRFLLLVALLVTLLSTRPVIAAEADTLPAGTVITMQNWQQYKNFLPDGMQKFFAGDYYWKFPADIQIVIGPTSNYQVNKTYVENTEKYANQVKIVDLPDGQHTLKGYVAGRPFPNPSGTRKGWEILVDIWYRCVPYLTCTTDSIPAFLTDRFGHRTVESVKSSYRRMGHISEPGMPIYLADGQGIDFSEWIRVIAPEQTKYLTNLTLYYLDPAKPEDIFLFIPALRRSLRLSTAARCSPFIGTDLTQDDPRSGWNGGITRFDATFLRDQKIISMVNANPKALGTLANYYPVLFFPTPKVGKWEVRDTWVIDVRRIPQQRNGYCYGKQIIWVDKISGNALWKDMYDANLKYWKSDMIEHIASPVPGQDLQYETTNFWQGTYDMQNDHYTVALSADPAGQWSVANEDCKNAGGIDYFDNVKQYNTVAGLAQVMR